MTDDEAYSRGEVIHGFSAAGRVLTTSIMTSAAAIRSKIDVLNPSLVLVDYFDTLVTRAVANKQIKPIVARHVRDRFELGCDPGTLHSARRTAEELVRRRQVDAGYDPEHRIDEMAGEIWTILESEFEGSIAPSRETFTAGWIAIELAVERLAQQVDTDVVEVVRSIAGSRPLVIVSDFHIPSTDFRSMLAWHGLDSLFDEVFVSCDARLSKASGRLYGHVLEALEDQHGPLDPGRILMIGDNPVSDGTRAEEAGLATVAIHRPAERPRIDRVRRRANETSLARLTEARAAVDVGGPAPFGELAATLFIFTRLLHQRAVRHGHDPLLFLAREGQFLKRVFDLYQETSPAAAGSSCKTEYLVVSRRSTALPGLGPIETEDFSSILNAYPGLSMRDLLASIGFEVEAIRQLGRRLGVAIGEPVLAGVLIADEEFRHLYASKREEQRRLLSNYVDDLAGGTSACLHVVDVGWKGTIQDHLKSALGPDRSITGLYLGVVASEDVPNGDDKVSILFDSRDPVTPEYRILRHFKSLYEYVLQADHGSAAEYRSDVDGEVVPVLDTQHDEEVLFRELIGPIQESIVAGFAELCRRDGLRDRPLIADLSEVARLHARMLFFPRRDEIGFVRSLRHYENFGPMRFEAAGRIETGPGRLRALLSVIREPRRVLISGWPPLNLASLGLQPLIPILGLYRCLREVALPWLRLTGGRIFR